MILEISPHRFVISNAKNGDLTRGWMPIPGARDPPVNGGPSLRWNPIDSMYYCILGGHHVELLRTRDFVSYERSKNAPFIEPTVEDGQIAPFAGFPKVAESRGFLPMANDTSRWDWNSNDADVCCMGGGNSSWVIWGAGTQGAAPKPPLSKANHCANIVATANLSLAQLLVDHFK